MKKNFKNKVKILSDTNYEDLSNRMSKLGAELILKSLELIKRNKDKYTNQDEKEASYAKKIDKSESKINWNDKAKKIIAKNEDRYSPESQAVQVAVMVALSNIKDFQEYQNLEITESLTWYQTQNIYQDQEMIFDTNAYYLHHIEDKMFNDFENLQWQLQ